MYAEEKQKFDAKMNNDLADKRNWKYQKVKYEDECISNK